MTVTVTVPTLTVPTVTGPIAPADLGTTLMHEHVIVASPGLRAAYPQTFDRAAVLRSCMRQLRALRAAGVRTLVDHSPYDLGRDVELLAEVSRGSGLQIVCCTGVWVEPARFFEHRSPDEIARLFVDELRDGVAGTGIRPGIIKCATGPAGLTPTVEKVLRACARAHLATGAPISTHTDAAARTGEVQQRLFDEEGVDLRRVVIGHSGDSEDLGYLRGLLAAGSYLGMDRFGAEDILPDDRRMDVVARLCADGLAKQLLLSHDASCWTDRHRPAQVARHRANWHHRHIGECIRPGLRARGVSEEQIVTMLVDNPQRIFDIGRLEPHHRAGGP